MGLQLTQSATIPLYEVTTELANILIGKPTLEVLHSSGREMSNMSQIVDRIQLASTLNCLRVHEKRQDGKRLLYVLLPIVLNTCNQRLFGIGRTS